MTIESDVILCLQGVKTIGYGHACQPASECNNINAPITEAEGKDLLKSDAASFVTCVNSNVDVPVSWFPDFCHQYR